MSFSKFPFHSSYSLKKLNTFNVHCRASFFSPVNTKQELLHTLESYQNTELAHHDIKVLGGGSNILFIKDFNGVIIKNNIATITVLEQDKSSITVKVGAGKNWHDFVTYCTQRKWYGLENLALIPGTVGAAPIQNIGAYGVEVGQYIKTVETINLKNGNKRTFSHKQCQFDYRTSTFKTTPNLNIIVTYVVFQLPKISKPSISYPTLKNYLQIHNITHPTSTDIFEAIISIRTKQLPDHTKVGTAGSFFVNPIVSQNQLEQLTKQYPSLPHYEIKTTHSSKKTYKIPAAWLIEQTNWKGYRRSKLGVWPYHALILVNYGEISGAKIYQLAQEISISVYHRFGIRLKPEVCIM